MTTTRWRVALWLIMLAVVLLVVWQARRELIPFAIGALLAFMLTPVVDGVAALLPSRLFSPLSSRSHQWNVYRRGVAVLMVYVVIGAGLFGVGSVIIPVAGTQVADFVEELPRIIEDAQDQGSDLLTQYRRRVPADVQVRVDSYLDDAGDRLATELESMLRRSVKVVPGAMGVIFGFVIVPFWMFYALRDRHQVGRNFANAVPEGLREDATNILAIADRLLLRYVRAQVFLGVVVGTAVGVGLTLLHIPLSLALGLFAGITELIPIIGPWIGAVPGVLIAVGTEPDKLPWVALLYFGVQQAENNLLVPRVQSQAVELHPAMVILLLVVAGAVFGFIGLIVIVPLTAILRELFWYLDRRLSGATPAEAIAQSRVAQRPDAPARRRLRLPFRLRRARRSDQPVAGEAPAAAPVEGTADTTGKGGNGDR